MLFLKQISVFYFAKFLSFVNSSLAAKYMTPELLGPSTIIQSISSNLYSFADLGLNDYASREKLNPKINNIFFNILFYRFSITLLIFAPLIFILKTEIFNLDIWWCLLVFLTVLRLATDTLFYFRTIDRMEIYYLISIIPPLITSVIYFIFIKNIEIEAFDLLIVVSSSLIANLILIFIIFKKIKTYHIQFNFIFNYFKKNLKLIISSSLNIYTSSGILLIAAYFLSIKDMGIIRASFILVVPLEMLFTLYSNWLFPKVICWINDKFYSFEYLKFLKYYVKIFFLLIIIFPIFVFLFLEIVGEDFFVDLYFILILGSSKLVSIFFLPYQIAIYTDKSNLIITKVSLTNFFFTILVSFFFISSFGVIGVAFSILFLDMFYSIICIYYSKNYLKIISL